MQYRTRLRSSRGRLGYGVYARIRGRLRADSSAVHGGGQGALSVKAVTNLQVACALDRAGRCRLVSGERVPDDVVRCERCDVAVCRCVRRVLDWDEALLAELDRETCFAVVCRRDDLAVETSLFVKQDVVAVLVFQSHERVDERRVRKDRVWSRVAAVALFVPDTQQPPPH